MSDVPCFFGVGDLVLHDGHSYRIANVRPASVENGGDLRFNYEVALLDTSAGQDPTMDIELAYAIDCTLITRRVPTFTSADEAEAWLVGYDTGRDYRD